MSYYDSNFLLNLLSSIKTAKKATRNIIYARTQTGVILEHYSMESE